MKPEGAGSLHISTCNFVAWSTIYKFIWLTTMSGIFFFILFYYRQALDFDYITLSEDEEFGWIISKLTHLEPQVNNLFQ